MHRRNLTHRLLEDQRRGLEQERRVRDAEAALHQSEDRFRALVENLRDLVFTVDTQGTIIYVSPSSLAMSGYTPSELLGRPFLEFIAEEDRTRILEVVAEALGGAELETEYRVVRKGGELLWVRSKARIFYVDGALGGLQGVLTDISLQKRAAEARERYSEELEARVAQRTAELLELNRELRAREEAARLLETIAAGANALASVEQALLLSLEAMCRYRDWPCGLVWVPAPEARDTGAGLEIVPTRLWCVADAERCAPLRRTTMARHFGSGECLPGRVLAGGVPLWLADLAAEPRCLRCQDALAVGFHTSVGLPVVVAGKVEAVFEFFCDGLEAEDPELLDLLMQAGSQLGRAIERHQTIEALERATEAAAAASRSKSLFLANMSHEIRTPLNAILGFANLLALEVGLSSQARDYIETIGSAGQHLLGIINDVLEVSKIEAGRAPVHLSSFELDAFIADLKVLYGLRAEQKGLGFSVELTASAPRRIYTDKGKLRQILVNLLANAIKYTDTGHVALVLHGGFEQGRTLLICQVEDTGIGISEGFQKEIFAPFVQNPALERGGVGLGLAICRRQVELLHGHLSVSSQLGQGSIFSVVLPLSDDPAASTPAPRVSGVKEVGSGFRKGLKKQRPPRESVARLPASLTAGLLRAAQTGDVAELERLCGEVAQTDAELAEVLTGLARSFALRDLLALLAGAP